MSKVVYCRGCAARANTQRNPPRNPTMPSNARINTPVAPNRNNVRGNDAKSTITNARYIPK